MQPEQVEVLRVSLENPCTSRPVPHPPYSFFIVIVSSGYQWYIDPKFADAFTVVHDSCAVAGLTVVYPMKLSSMVAIQVIDSPLDIV